MSLSLQDHLLSCLKYGRALFLSCSDKERRTQTNATYYRHNIQHAMVQYTLCQSETQSTLILWKNKHPSLNDDERLLVKTKDAEQTDRKTAKVLRLYI
jgi:hypothetical protein